MYGIYKHNDNRMKSKKDIQAEVEATLNLASEIATVEPSTKLKGRILHRMEKREPKVIPLYRRPAIAVAAAAVILALNLFTVIYFTRQESVQSGLDAPTDRLAEIQSAYSLDESIY
jgi:hypothetical protein